VPELFIPCIHLLTWCIANCRVYLQLKFCTESLLDGHYLQNFERNFDMKGSVVPLLVKKDKSSHLNLWLGLLILQSYKNVQGFVKCYVKIK
jgi:hypothetical protein